jgi:hypothetical protein
MKTIHYMIFLCYQRIYRFHWSLYRSSRKYNGRGGSCKHIGCTSWIWKKPEAVLNGHPNKMNWAITFVTAMESLQHENWNKKLISSPSRVVKYRHQRIQFTIQKWSRPSHRKQFWMPVIVARDWWEMRPPMQTSKFPLLNIPLTPDFKFGQVVLL